MSPTTPSRRRFLRAVAGLGTAASVATAGCLGLVDDSASGAGDGAGDGTATGSPTESPHVDPARTPDCAELRRHPIDLTGYRLHETYDGFAIDAERDGDELVVRLRNETDEPALTGNRWKYAVQQLDDEWLHRLWVPRDHGWTDEAIEHAPGEGFTWAFGLDRTGLSQGPFRGCTAVRPGRYRFVYFGVIDAEAEGDHALVAPFDVPE